MPKACTCQVSRFERESHVSRHQITLSRSPPLFSR